MRKSVAALGVGFTLWVGVVVGLHSPPQARVPDIAMDMAFSYVLLILLAVLSTTYEKTKSRNVLFVMAGLSLLIVNRGFQIYLEAANIFAWSWWLAEEASTWLPGVLLICRGIWGVAR
ncbi:MAG: hypothetical protein GXO65_07540 [Euryarchaeota archaeon]|nr:hypothetical protein [Euryarchaeota archaeon]